MDNWQQVLSVFLPVTGEFLFIFKNMSARRLLCLCLSQDRRHILACINSAFCVPLSLSPHMFKKLGTQGSRFNTSNNLYCFIKDIHKRNLSLDCECIAVDNSMMSSSVGGDCLDLC